MWGRAEDGGASAGLEQIIESRIGHKGVGFHGEVRSQTDRDPGELFSQVLPEDLVKFGMIPEFVDLAPEPGTLYTYAVRAVSAEGVESSAELRASARSGAVERVLLRRTFEQGTAGWSPSAPDDAEREAFDALDALLVEGDEPPAGFLDRTLAVTARRRAKSSRVEKVLGK